MGLFLNKAKETVLDAIDIDLSIYPDNSFTQEQCINKDGKNIINHYLYLEEGLLLNLFPQLMVITFDDSYDKNYIFRCPVFEEFKKSSLIELVNNISDVYGPDAMGNNKFSAEDWKQIKEGFWIGRNWMNDKYPITCLLYFDQGGNGLSFTIWTN